MSKTVSRTCVRLAFLSFLISGLVTGAFAQETQETNDKQETHDAQPGLAGTWFAPGNLVVAVAGCGVYGGTCVTPPVGGTGTGGTYGDDQASPWTLFQYMVNGATSAAFVNSLQLPQTLSGTNFPVSDDFGSQSEGTVQLSGNGEYLTMIGYGINAADFNVNYLLYCPGSTNASNACVPENGNPATAQTGNLTAPVAGVSGTTAVPRVAILIDPNGNVNTSTVLYNIFDENDARSAYSPDGVNIYVSGQGCKTCGPTPNQIPASGDPFDNTMGVYYTPIGVTNTAPTPITGLDNGPTGCTAGNCTSSEDTRMVQIYNNTLYVSTDAKPGSPGYNRSLIGTLGSPASTTQYLCASGGNTCPTGDGPYGPSIMPGLGNTGGTGKYTINTQGSGNTSNGNNLNNTGLAINLSPQNFWFASPTVLYVADTGSPKNHSNGPDTICTNDGTTDSATVGDGGLQKWILNPTTTATLTSGSASASYSSGALFTQGEVGLAISGTGIPAGTTITAVSSAGKTATMSANATVSHSETVTVSGWSLAYTLYNGLNLVLNVDCDPSNDNTTGTGATGLYGVTGVVNSGVATLYVTDYPNDDLLQTYLYGITDTLATTTMTSPGTAFTVLDTAPAGSLFRGVSFVPSIPSGSVDITSVPSGLTVSTSGTGCDPGTITTPLMEAWTPSSSCTLSVTSPQTVGGVQYTFSSWQDSSTGLSDVVTAPTTTATYTATFTAQYQLTTSATTGGTVSSGGYYNPGANATITATPSANYCFVNFTAAAQLGYPPLASSTSTSNPFTLQMNSPETITANFAQGSGLYSPAGGSTLTGTSATFNWCAIANATAYWLDVGNVAGGNQYYQSGSLPVTTESVVVNSLPNNGSTVYATWYYLLNGSWVSNPYTYTAFGGGTTKGIITSPVSGSTLSGTSVMFSWSPSSVSGADYWIDAGSSAGGNQYFQSGNIGTVTSETISTLPSNGSTVYVTLYTLVSGQWLPNAYTYTAYSLAAQDGMMQTPTPGSTLTSGTVTFTWTAGAGASAYWLDVGSTAGGNQYYQSGNLGGALTTTVSGLPEDGSTIYVTLYSLVGGQWSPNAYTYTAFNLSGGTLAVMQTPVPNSFISGTSATFTWSLDSNATAYWVDISAVSPGGNDVFQSGNLGNVSSVTVNSLPGNGSSTLYVTLYSLVGGQWLSNAYTYTN
jgi:List-Bact-rpt repeat protein